MIKFLSAINTVAVWRNSHREYTPFFKIKIFKANEKYKKIQKSGKKINIIMLGDSIPKGDICNERKKNSS